MSEAPVKTGIQTVLLSTTSESRRQSVETIFGGAGLQPVHCPSPAALLENLQRHSWDVILLDGDASAAPVAKLLEVVGAHVALTSTLVVVLTSQAQPLTEVSEALHYHRPIRPVLLLGAMNRILISRAKEPILQASVALDSNLRRALRVPLLVPVAFRAGGDQAEWSEGEVRDVSSSGASLAALGGLAAGQNLGLKNMLTGQEAAFRVVWVGDDQEGLAAGLKAENEDLASGGRRSQSPVRSRQSAVPPTMRVNFFRSVSF